MEYEGKHILVLGIGTSGIGVAKVLAKLGAKVILNDLKKVDLTESQLQQLKMLDIEVITGRQDNDLLTDIDLLISSPGIPLTIPITKEAKNRNIPVTGEIEIAYDIAKGPILGVTGTNGKTTTTMLLAEVMKHTGKSVCVGGNIGDALSEQVFNLPADGVVVAELSSYQLESIINFKTHGAIVLNLTPDHLERHKTMEAYQAAKENIFKNQTSEDVTVLNYDDEAVRHMAERVPGQVLYISQKEKVDNGAYFDGQTCYAVANKEVVKVIDQVEIQLPGAHNIENILAVIALTYKLGISVEIIKKSIQNFSGVEHRIEPVRIIDGVTYYNDSKATNTDSVIKALEAFNQPIVLIAGGYDKMTDLTDMMKLAAKKTKAIIMIGAAAQRFTEAAVKNGNHKILQASSMLEAVQTARQEAVSGDIVLLSPACSSYDWYICFEERGDDFKKCVNSLT